MLISQMVAYMSEVCMKVHILCVVLKNVMQNNDKTMIKQGLLQLGEGLILNINGRLSVVSQQFWI